MAKKIKKTQLDSLINPSQKEVILYENKLEQAEEIISEGEIADVSKDERPGWEPETIPSETQNTKKIKAFANLFSRRQKAPEVTPVQSGSVDILDIIAPASADLYHRDYIAVDGIYFAYLYLTGYGYPTTVGNGWLNPLVEAGEGINLIFTINRQPKDKTLSKISQATMINRSRMRDVGDTRTDYEELDSAINAGMYLKDGMNRYNEDFYYMHTMIEISAENLDLLEQRIAAVQNLCVSQDMFCKRADYKHSESFISALPLLRAYP